MPPSLPASKHHSLLITLALNLLIQAGGIRLAAGLRENQQVEKNNDNGML